MSGGWGTPHPGTYPELGEVFVQGKTQQMARELLAAADALGVDRVLVRTTIHGFIVPDAVWDQAEQQRLADSGMAV